MIQETKERAEIMQQPKQPRLNYQMLQKIKAEEYAIFFDAANLDYYPYLNHLGEMTWMTHLEAENQHEYYPYTPSSYQNFKRRLSQDAADASQVPADERELRLQFRAFLERRYLGGIQPETLNALPNRITHELSEDEIDNIPMTLDLFDTSLPSRVWIYVLLAALIGLAGYFFISSESQPSTGSLLLESNVRGATIFIDGVKRGYADRENLLKDIEVGTHEISLTKNGYVSNPRSRQIEIFQDSLTSLRFHLERSLSGQSGFVSIQADYADSKIFIDDEFYGLLTDQQVFSLGEGEHSIAIEKNGYTSSPASQIVNIVAGDTLNLQVRQSAAAANNGFRRRSTDNRRAIGSLDISTNISGGKIILNNQDTGLKTDHVFTQLPLGTYTIRIEREGYQTFPSEHTVTLSVSEPRADFNFEMVREYETVQIEVTPRSAEIFVDGKSLGTGGYNGPLKVGVHKLSFGKVAGYNAPPAKTIKVEENRQLNLSFDYFPKMNISAGINDDGNIQNKKCNIQTGYTFNNRGFTSSREAGPEITYIDDLKDYFWKFGYAFPYRNPKGNDALRVSFTLPQNVDYSQKFTLNIMAIASKDRYPLTLTGKIDIKIKLNGKILSYYYDPRQRDDESGLREFQLEISQHLKPGTNALEISTTEDNNTYYLLKEVRIFN